MLRQQLVQFARGAQFIENAGDTSSLHSPYGDDWDLLLLGHCGAGFRTDIERYWAIHDDPTVPPQSQYKPRFSSAKFHPPASLLQPGNFTRLISPSTLSLCTYGYAMSLRGATKFLYHFSIEPNADVFDAAVQKFCSTPKYAAKCVTVFPSLLDQYRPAGPTVKDSDHHDKGGETRAQGASDNIVFPVKAGLRDVSNMHSVRQSQWPDDSLWPHIDSVSDELPVGEGVVRIAQGG